MCPEGRRRVWKTQGALTLAEQKERGEGEQLWLWGGEAESKGVLGSCEGEERSEGRKERRGEEKKGKLLRQRAMKPRSDGQPRSDFQANPGLNRMALLQCEQPPSNPTFAETDAVSV